MAGTTIFMGFAAETTYKFSSGQCIVKGGYLLRGFNEVLENT